MKCFSIIIPVYNEEDNIVKLINEIYSLDFAVFDFETIVVDDKSSDNTFSLLKKCQKKYSNLKVLKHDNNKGQSFALKTGINSSLYNNIITIDGDGQNDPKDILKLCSYYFDEHFSYKLIGGLRKNRKDSYLKKYSSFIANKIRKNILKDKCNDTGCSLKIFDKKIFLSFPFFNGIHRFLPALFNGYGFETFFLDVNHRSRIHGISKYGTIDRLIKGIIDIVRVKIIINRYKK